MTPDARPPITGEQSGPERNPFGHAWGKPYSDGYATCPCGARENTQESAMRCPLADERDR